MIKIYGRAKFTLLRNRKKQGYFSRLGKGILCIYDRGYTNLTGILPAGESLKNGRMYHNQLIKGGELILQMSNYENK